MNLKAWYTNRQVHESGADCFAPDMEWLESSGDFSRYWIGGEESIWLCDHCDCEADPDEDHECVVI